MRFLIAIAALTCLALTARADEPAKKYYLIDGKITEQRVADLEARVSQLEKQLAAKTSAPTSTAKSDCQCQPHQPGAPWTAANNCGLYSCPANGGGGGCPCATAAPAISTPATEYVQVCENGRCSLRAVPASATAASSDFGSPMAAAFGSCASGSCSAPQATGWYPGKLLGRRR